jgi:hypothetical protein
MVLSLSVNGLSNKDASTLFSVILYRAILNDIELAQQIQDSDLMKRVYNALNKVQ